MKRILTGLRWGAGATAILAGMAGLFAACNQHPVSYSAAVGSVEFLQTTSVDGSTKLDMLWVVDNSGSMCQEQKILRDNFNTFIEQLESTNLDFHIGVTTTHMKDDWPLEPVAIPGNLQSTPQPVPGFDSSCHTAVDETGQQIEGDYQPIRNAVQAAIDCMENPDQSILTNLTNAEIECALYNQPNGCSIARVGCDNSDPDNECTAADIFPDPSSYRAIPKVLKSEDYKDGAALDVDALKSDFACMALVGTRGYGIEKGLSALALATSLEKTGGAVGTEGANTSAPNHGLIRPNARFAAIFVTDENDCSHDGNLDESTPCGGDVCEFANKEGADSPLVPPADFKGQLMDNLRETKGNPAFGEADVLVASIHGNYKRFMGEVPTDSECGASDYEGISPSCATSLGVAFSGDRYERFLQSFPEGQYYPAPREDDPEAHLTGWMCTGDFRPALQAIGEFFTQAAGGCITRPIFPCEDSSQCPDYPFTGEAGSCVERPNSDGEMYCDSAVQVRAVAQDQEAFTNLQDSGYCVDDSVGSEGLAQGCVIQGDKFSFVPCSGGVSGIKLQWANDNEARNALLNADLQLRYNSVTSN
jgi:hypothetical protein